MNTGWYVKIKSSDPLSQGELIMNFPIQGQAHGIRDSPSTDVIVLTQACDLANDKTRTVLVCPNLPLKEYCGYRNDDMRRKGHTPTKKSWTKHIKSLVDGEVIGRLVLNSGKVGQKTIEHRLVDFREVYTIQKKLLEGFARATKKTTRIALCPPYREHFAQAFARLFMRVALPENINPVIAANASWAP